MHRVVKSPGFVRIYFVYLCVTFHSAKMLNLFLCKLSMLDLWSLLAYNCCQCLVFKCTGNRSVFQIFIIDKYIKTCFKDFNNNELKI